MFRFHYERIVRKLSRAKLGEMAGIQKGHLMLMEQGRLVPTDDELQRLSKALKLTPSSVLMKPVLVEPAENDASDCTLQASAGVSA